MSVCSPKSRWLAVVAAAAAVPALAALFASARPDKVIARQLDFVAYGDSRHFTKIHARICKSIVAAEPKYVIATGDLVDYPERPAQWTEWAEITKELRSRSRLHSAAGNHDLSKENLYQKTLGLDRLYFDVKEGDVHLFILDSNTAFDDRTQLEWFEKTARASTSKHKFAVFHHPPFTVGPKKELQAAPIRPIIHPLLVKLKFCAAFCGHHHAYYNTVRDGVRYVVSAGGGAPLSDVDPTMKIAGDRYRSFHHFTGFRFSGGKILGSVYDKDGVEVPEFAFTLCDHP